jgi:MerR family transcriptional regulator, light-induced transcriptional regulator
VGEASSSIVSITVKTFISSDRRVRTGIRRISAINGLDLAFMATMAYSACDMKRSSRSSGRTPAAWPGPASLSPARAAELVGVSESTLKRWVDAGHVRAEKTAGGHRRIAVPDLLAFLRGRGRAGPSLAALGLRAGPRRPRSPAASLSPEALADLLLAGDVPLARGLLLDAYAAGRPLDELGDAVIGPAMARVGALWADRAIDVYQEHLATQRLASVLLELRGLVPTPGERAPLAAGGAPEGDPYLLPSAVVELTLLELGWRVLNLGAETPMASLAAAVRQHRARLVWISVTSTRPAAAFLEAYPRLVEAARSARAGLIVGGQGLTPDLQHRLVAAAFGTRLAHLREFARALAP